MKTLSTYRKPIVALLATIVFALTSMACLMSLFIIMPISYAQTLSPADVLIYLGDVWWLTPENAAEKAETTQILLETAGIQSEITEDEDYVAQWMLQTTSDGSVDVLILYGVIPPTIYPLAHIKPDGSIAENWIETLDGNTILNQGDYFGFWGGTPKSLGDTHLHNGPEGLQNIMDIPGITMWGDTFFPGGNARWEKYTPMTVTVDGSALTPSLMDFHSYRPFNLDKLQGEWFAEKIFASNTGDARATRADPVIVRDGKRGRIAVAQQTNRQENPDNPKGEVAAEIIINYLLAGETLTTGISVDPTVTTIDGTEEPVGQTVRSGDKITGPWLWMIAPTAPGQGGQRSIGVDSLSDASGGAVTEADVAANGANEGDLVANLAWTLGEISDTGGNNVNALVNAIGFAAGDVNDHSAYALITLESTSVQNNVTMRVGSDDAIKVWLNGEVVHTNAVNRGAGDFQDVFPVNLRRGDNLLLVKVSERGGGWSMFVGIDANVNAIYKPASTQPSVKPTDTTDEVAADPAGDVNHDGQWDDSLILYLSFDELDGDMAIDHSQYKNHGTLAGAPELVPGKFGNALKFNGQSDWVEVPHADILTVEEGVTVMAWINTERHARHALPYDRWQGILAKGDKPRSYSFYTELPTECLLFDGGSGSVCTAGKIALNEWQHVAVAAEGGTHRYWLNGENVGEFGGKNPLPGAADTASVLVGRTHEVNREFLGLIDEVRIWNRALSGAEIRAEMAIGNVLTSVATDEVAAAYPAWDVNEDGQTDVADLLLVVAAMGQANPANPRTDVNRDGTVDAQDILLVAQHLGESTNPAAPASVVLPAGLTSETVQHVLTLLRTQDDGSPAFHRSIALLEQILAALIPKETALLTNYPNPFNPETWIPYHLATSADVTLRIYAVNGTLVRHLALGHQPAGHYQRRGRAAYWDGKNEQGEPVASGIYFYTLTAGEFTATRKMLIQK